MSGPRRRRWLPLAFWAVVVGLFVATMFLGMKNGSIAEDFLFIGLFVAMVWGYATVGAVLATRVPANPIGWLMILAGGSYMLAGLSSEYARYTLSTAPGSMPFASAAVWITSWAFIPALGAIVLILLLFPTGRVHSHRWRLVPAAAAALFGVVTVSQVLRPGPVDVADGVQPLNPAGIPALGGLIDAIQMPMAIAAMSLAVASIVAVFLRFRRARGEERQQLRWLVSVVTLTFLLLVGVVLTSIGIPAGESRPVNDVFFMALFAVIGIGIPVAMAVAILRFHLYDLEVVIKKTLVFGILVALITGLALLGLFVASGIVVGPVTDSPAVTLFAGVAIGALAWPLRRVAHRVADRLVYGGRATPYEVLAEFSEHLSETLSTEDVLGRIAAVLGAGTGATRVTVWLRIEGHLRPEAAWPEAALPPPMPMRGESLPAFPGGEHAVAVRHQGDFLGALSIEVPANDPMNPSKAKLVEGLASQAGLVLRNVRLIEELRASRRRIVTSQDERAKKLERDLHDGAQQQLVALSVKLGLASQLAERDANRTKALLEQLQGDASGALENLRDLARGIYPPVLADQGLTAALTAQAGKAPVPVEVVSDGIGRHPQEVETAMYFCVLEAMQNVGKYARASRAVVRLARSNGTLLFEVEDDGRGFDPEVTGYGTGLQGMADRLEAVGGRLDVSSALGEGTRVVGRVPVGSGAIS